MLGLSKMKFFTRLLEKSQSEPEVEEEGSRFVISVTDLLEKLLDYRLADILSRIHSLSLSLSFWLFRALSLSISVSLSFWLF